MRIIIVLLSSFLLMSCSGVSFSEWHFPYMMEVQQGMYINKDQLSQIRVGMTKDQVVFVLGGYPLTQYMFEQNRWDFMYQDYQNNSFKRGYSLSLFFDKNSQVTRIVKQGQFFNE